MLVKDSWRNWPGINSSNPAHAASLKTLADNSKVDYVAEQMHGQFGKCTALIPGGAW